MRAFKFIVPDSDERSDDPQTKELFEDRVQEFWDIINMSFSSPSADEWVTTYASLSMPKVFNRPGYWCPIAEPQQALSNWSDYSQPAREAIRRGFRRGVGRLTDFWGAEIYEKWVLCKSGLMEITPPNLQLIRMEAERTGQYAIAQARIELCLRDIYSEAKFIPYHPDYDKVFIAKLGALSLHRIDSFLEETCQRDGLQNEDDQQYLADLITEVAEMAWLTNPSKTKRARTWLASRLSTSSDKTGDVKTALFDWELIDSLAERVKLRIDGRFQLSAKYISAAMVGFIDALCVEQKLPSTSLANIYTAFTKHYGTRISADRHTATRSEWKERTLRVL